MDGLFDWLISAYFEHYATTPMLIFQAWATCGMVDWLIDWLFDWLTDLLTVWMVDLLMDRPFDWLTDWLTVWMVYMYWVTDRLFDGLTDWVTGHPSSQRRRSWSSIQQWSTITSCSYFQSMWKEKVLEKFSAYLTNNNQLSTHQSGNKKLHSTETLNIHLTEHN